MIDVNIKLYEYKELKKDAQLLAYNDHREFLLSTYQANNYDSSFNMTYNKYKAQLRKCDVIESIEINEYLFFTDGTLTNTISYCGKHPRAGENIFIFKGVEYPYNLKQG